MRACYRPRGSVGGRLDLRCAIAVLLAACGNDGLPSATSLMPPETDAWDPSNGGADNGGYYSTSGSAESGSGESGSDESGSQAHCEDADETCFDWRDAVIYFVFVDRFFNGDTSNDGGIGVPDASNWQGGDWAGVGNLDCRPYRKETTDQG